jgi:hypothetical protein
VAKMVRKFRKNDYSDEYDQRNGNKEKKGRLDHKELRRMKREYDEYESRGYDDRTFKHVKY